MASMNVSGLPALAWSIGFVVIGAAPVWLAAKLTGAGSATLLRSALALLIGTIGGVIGIAAGGPFALLLVPLAFLLSFKFVLDTSFLGAFFLGILAVAGYFAMAHFIGGGVSVGS